MPSVFAATVSLRSRGEGWHALSVFGLRERSSAARPRRLCARREHQSERADREQQSHNNSRHKSRPRRGDARLCLLTQCALSQLGFTKRLILCSHTLHSYIGVAFRAQTIQYTAKNKVVQSETRELASLERGKVGPRDVDQWRSELLYIPPLPPTNLRGCHLIKIQYDVYVSGAFSSSFKGATAFRKKNSAHFG